MAEHGPTVLRVCRAVVDPVDADDAWSETAAARLCAPTRTCPPTPTSRLGSSQSPTAAPSTSDAPARRSADPDALTRPARRRTDPLETRDPDLWARCSGCPAKQRQAWPTTTSAACPSPRSPNCSATPPPPRACRADGLQDTAKHYREDESA